MVFKPNYNFQKAERDRAKAAKKEQKSRDKEEAKRRAEAGEPPLEGTAGETTDESGADITDTAPSETGTTAGSSSAT